MLKAIIKSKEDEDVCLMITSIHQKMHYICDCGYASQLSIKDYKHTQAFFISHTHIDHFCHFDTFLRHQLPTGREIVVCGTKNLAKHLQAKVKAYDWKLLTVNDQTASYQIREIQDEGVIVVYRLKPPTWKLQFVKKYKSKYIYEDEIVRVSYALLNHIIPTASFLFRESDKRKLLPNPYGGGAWVRQLKEAFEAGRKTEIIIIDEQTSLPAEALFQYLTTEAGYSIAFVMDHLASEENHQKIKNLCAEGVDEMYIECFYADEDHQLALLNHHSTASASGTVAALAGAKKVYPLHFSRRYTEETIQKVKQTCHEAFQKNL